MLYENKGIYDDILMCSNCGTFNDISEVLCSACGHVLEDEYNDKFDKNSLLQAKQGSIILNEINENKTIIAKVFTDKTMTELENFIEKIKLSAILIEQRTDLLTNAMTSASGKKVLQTFNIDLSKKSYNEYHIECMFFSSETSVLNTMFNLFNEFPIAMVREEKSNYLISSNKGLAKAVLEQNGKDHVEVFSNFLNGYERFSLLSLFLSFAGPADIVDKNANDILVLWTGGSLISAQTIINTDTIPTDWQDYLFDTDTVKISKEAKDNGTEYSWSEIYKHCVESESSKSNTKITICSVRGINKSEEQDDEDKK